MPSAELFHSSPIQLRAATAAVLTIVLTFATSSFVRARVPTQQPAVPAVNEKIHALAEALRDANAGVRGAAATASGAIGP